MAEKEMPSHHGVKVSHRIKDKYPNETIKLLYERASCRRFQDREVEEEVLNTILEAGVHAPSGGNLQPVSIIKIRDKKRREKMGKLSGQKFVEDAPVSLLFCIDWRRHKRWAELETAPFTADRAFRHFWISIQDVIICAQNICTAADSMGLGSCYIGTVMEWIPAAREMFDLPKGVVPVVLLCMGYPQLRPLPRKKLDAKFMVHPEKYVHFDDETILKEFKGKYPEEIDITDNRLSQIKEVCRKVHGNEFAKECVNKIKENGYISPVQRYFALHYNADVMPRDNKRYLQLMKDCGFHWFEEYNPETGNGDDGSDE